MSEIPNSDHDEKLSSVYRAAPSVEPPGSLDDAIRAAARREAGARPRAAGAPVTVRWQRPLSIAAVLVLCVSLVAIMRDEGGDLTRVPRADAPSPAASARNSMEVESAVPKVELAPEASRSKNIGRNPLDDSANVPRVGTDILSKPDRAVGIAGGGGRSQEAKRITEAHVAEAFPRRAPPSPIDNKTEVASADGEALNAAKANARRDAAPDPRQASATTEFRGRAQAEVAPAAAVGKLASINEPATAIRQQPAIADRMERDARTAAMPLEAQAGARPASPPAAAPVARTLEKSAKETTGTVEEMARLAPDKWLARIEELRRSGRIDEARAGFAEFRKRYPDYVLPASLRDWVQP